MILLTSIYIMTLQNLCMFGKPFSIWQVYFGVSSVTISLFLYDERRYLSGESETPEEMSFIGNTQSKWLFN